MTNHDMQNQMKSLAATLNEVMSTLQNTTQKLENKIYDEIEKLEEDSDQLVGTGSGRTN